MKIVSIRTRSDGKHMVVIDFTHIVKTYCMTTDKLEAIKTKCEEHKQQKEQNEHDQKRSAAR